MAHCFKSGSEMNNIACVFCGHEDKCLWFLDCLHSCCEECLPPKPSSITCPRCAELTPVDKHAPLKVNFLQATILKKARLTEPQVCMMCKSFGKSNIGKYVCSDCGGGQLCDDCVKAHATFPATSKHGTPVSLPELFDESNTETKLQAVVQTQATCPIHHYHKEPLTLKFFCKTCGVSACPMCVPIDHSTEEHNIVPLADFAQDQRKVMHQGILSILDKKKDIDTLVARIENKIERKKFEKEDLCNQVSDKVNGIKEELAKVEAKYLAQIEHAYEEQEHRNQNEVMTLESNKSEIENLVAVTTMMQLMGSDADIVENRQIVNKRLNKLARLKTTLRPAQDESLQKSKPKEDASSQKFEGLVAVTTMMQHIGSDTDVMENRGIISNRMNKAASRETTLRLAQGESLQISKPKQELSPQVLEDLIGILTPCKDAKTLISNSPQFGEGVTMGDQEFSFIRCIDFTTSEEILITGSAKHPVSKEFIAVYTTEGQQLTPINHDVNNVHAITANGDHVFVCALKNKYITKLDRHGEVLQEIGGRRCLARNSGLALGKNKCYITISSSKQILVVDMQPRDKYSFEDWKLPFSCSRLCVTPAGNIAVVADENRTIMLLDSDGRLISEFERGRLDSPSGLCSDSANRIYVADRANDRVCMFAPGGMFLANVVTGHSHGIKRPCDVKILNDMLAVLHSDNKVTIFRTINRD